MDFGTPVDTPVVVGMFALIVSSVMAWGAPFEFLMGFTWSMSLCSIFLLVALHQKVDVLMKNVQLSKSEQFLGKEKTKEEDVSCAEDDTTLPWLKFKYVCVSDELAEWMGMNVKQQQQLLTMACTHVDDYVWRYVRAMHRVDAKDGLVYPDAVLEQLVGTAMPMSMDDLMVLLYRKHLFQIPGL
jgi:hypothetical protein